MSVHNDPFISKTTEIFDNQNEENEISAIPVEILLEVFSFLNDGTSPYTIRLVNHDWAALSVNVIKREILIIKDFASFLFDNFKENNSFEKQVLYDVKNAEKSDFVNFLEAKSFCNKLKKQVLFALKGLSENDLKELETIAISNEKIPSFFNVFKLIEEGRQKHKNKLEEISAESDLRIRETNLKGLVIQLLEENDTNMTVEVIKIPPKKSSFCSAIAMQFLENSIALKQKEQKLEKEELKKEFNGLIDLAFRAANIIPNIYKKHSVFVRLFKELAMMDCLDQIKAKLYDPRFSLKSSDQSDILFSMINKIINENKLIHVVEFAAMFPPDRENDLMYISGYLNGLGESVLAQEVANLMSDDHQKMEFLELIFIDKDHSRK